MSLKERFIHPCSDFGFKKIFSSNKEILRHFLNEVLRNEKYIRALFYSKNEQMGNTSTDRNAVLDMVCKTGDGETILVEMQQVKQLFFKDRALYYVTFPIREQAMKGNGWNYELKEIYIISIMDFVFDDTHPDQYLHKVKLVETQTGEIFYHKLTFIYIELPKFNKNEHELATALDKWLYLFKKLNKFKEIPLILQEEPFKAVFDIAEVSNLTKEEMTAYEASLKQKRDWNSVLHTARMEGDAEGEKRGEKKGEKKGKIEVARNMKKKNIPLETIAEVTGLSIDEITRL